MDVWFCAQQEPRLNVAVKTAAIFALLLSASRGLLPLDKDLSWMSRFFFRLPRQTVTA